MAGTRICLAGYEFADGIVGRCVRPLPHDADPTESWLFQRNGSVMRPFSVVEFEIIGSRGVPPHTEDIEVRRRYRIAEPLIADDVREHLLAHLAGPDVASIFGAEVEHDQGWFVRHGRGERSLGTVRADVAAVIYRQRPFDDRWEYRLAFADEAGASYALAVTDLAFRAYLDDARDRAGTSPDQAAQALRRTLRNAFPVYLRIGLTRGWREHPDRCYLQVTGVHSIPDYLGGRCFADLWPPERKPSFEPVDLSDVPF